MTRKLLLQCKGLELEGIHVPTFQVCEGELIALVHPIVDGHETINLMTVLSGQVACQKVIVHCKTAFVHPFLCFGQYEPMIDKPLAELFRENGLTDSEVHQVIVAADLQPDLSYWQLQLTNRLLLEIKVSVLHGVKLIVFSTGGLDPLGVARVLIEARNSRTQCSSLALFHENLASDYELTGLLDRLCDRRLDIKKKRRPGASDETGIRARSKIKPETGEAE